MRRLILALGFTLCLFGSSLAQGNGNASGNGNGQSGWPAYWPNYVLEWLNQGGTLPQPLAMRIIHEVRDWGRIQFGLSQGQLVQRYQQGLLTIEFVQVAPPMLYFRVFYGGNNGIIVILDDL